jgi:serine/threonine-protein kinase
MTATAYLPGYLIAGKYELESLIGEGGMGAVWQARNVALDAPVALKVLRAAGDKALLRSRLMQEARAAAKLTHPAIVKVFDVGQTEGGDPFIVMELLEGVSLGKLLERDGRLPAVQAVRLLLPIADALWLAHEKGIVHRDLKPDNVFVVQQEGSIQPTLVDFGIVKIEEAAGSSHLTKAGDVLGSPDYMSPEQARGQDDVNHLTDVWSFSVMLFEAITGRTPFSGANYNALLRQIVEQTPPTLTQLSAGDGELSAIVARGLSKRPEQRYASMGELGRALASWLVKQGLTEDICGTTLEAKWLRSNEAHGRTGRVALGSIADWPIENGSGVRRNPLQALETVPAPPDALGATFMGRRARAPLKWLILGGIAALLLGGGAWAALRTTPPAAPAPSVTQPLHTGSPAAAPPAPPPPVAASPRNVESAQPAREAVSSDAGRAPAKTSQGARPKRKPPKRGGTPDKARAKSGDLLSPY